MGVIVKPILEGSAFALLAILLLWYPMHVAFPSASKTWLSINTFIIYMPSFLLGGYICAKNIRSKNTIVYLVMGAMVGIFVTLLLTIVVHASFQKMIMYSILSGLISSLGAFLYLKLRKK